MPRVGNSSTSITRIVGVTAMVKKEKTRGQRMIENYFHAVIEVVEGNMHKLFDRMQPGEKKGRDVVCKQNVEFL